MMQKNVVCNVRDPPHPFLPEKQPLLSVSWTSSQTCLCVYTRVTLFGCG